MPPDYATTAARLLKARLAPTEYVAYQRPSDGEWWWIERPERGGEWVTYLQNRRRAGERNQEAFDEVAKREVASLLSEVGWDAEDMGGVESARAIEPLCQLWCLPGFLQNQWTHAFKLLK